MEYYQQEKKQSTDTCYNTDYPWKHYAKWKNSDPKATCMIPQNVEKREIDRNWKSISSGLGLGVKLGVNCKLAQGNSVG